MSRYPQLFSEIKVGALTLRNRLCLTATLTNFGAANRVTERWIDFLAERAKGGTALLVSEIIAVDPEALAQGAIVTGFDDSNVEGFSRAAAAVKAAGAHLVGQLWHPGRQQLWHPTKAPLGVSDEPDALSWTVPHVMSAAEVRRVVAAFVEVAARLARCGFSGVELHGAHGYLIMQFLSPWSNKRTDAYGGGVEGRCRFAVEIAQGIRERVGSGFAIGLKMPASEGVEGGIDPAEAARITRHLAGAGLFDYFAYGQGNFSLSLEDHVPDMHYRPGHFIELHRRMREAAGGVPVMALGRIGAPELAEKVVAEGYGDLVGMCRALIADAAFAEKARAGRPQDIRPSVYDNFCWGEVHQGKPVAEFHNPQLGQKGEAGWRPAPAARRRRVAVVGAGPAGLEAAWIAAARGHAVTLFGASAEAGGKLRLEASLPGRGEMAKVCERQLRLAREHGVETRLGRRADAAAVRAVQPDAVILATGAALREPDALEHDGSAVSAREFATAPREGRAVLLYDHDHTAATYALADLLAERFGRVVLMTPRPQIAQAVNYCSAIGVQRRLRRAGVEILTGAQPLAFRGGVVGWTDVYSGARRAIEGVDLLVDATPRRADDGLAAELDGLDARLIGDCKSPRHLMAAIHEGAAAAEAI